MRAYQQLKNIYHFFQAHAWRFLYGRPDVGMNIYGVTGTNGKTTTCYLLANIFSERFGAERVGMLTTISMRIGNVTEVNETKLTTLPSRVVYRYLKQMKQAGVTDVVMEMTSHALDQNRLAGIQLAGAIVTHIEREHLNYHHTMEEYVAAKAKIIDYLAPKAPLVVKQDNKWSRTLAENRTRATQGRHIIWFTGEEAKNTATSLVGDMNKENALAAGKLARAVGCAEEDIRRGLQSIQGVPGRMEEVPNIRGIRIIIDYAVTPQALGKLYKDIRGQTKGRILAALGAAGLRDRGKRADMARTVAGHADLLVITREDPWTENEDQIFNDLERGLTGTKTPWKRIVDRKEALTYLLQRAEPGDSVIVTGKGAETGMGIGKKIVPYNERQAIEEILRKL